MKALIVIMIATANLHAGTYNLSHKIVVENSLADSYFVDKCIGTQVWRLYRGGYQGSLSQIMTRTLRGSKPLLCEDYKNYAKVNGIEDIKWKQLK